MFLNTTPYLFLSVMHRTTDTLCHSKVAFLKNCKLLWDMVVYTCNLSTQGMGAKAGGS
jgi:hypothetical protein